MNYSKMLLGIPTTYKGVEMKSRLEANIAYLLDGLELEWECEPKSFLLSNGEHYFPDFYLPDLDIYIEGKGKNTKKIEKTLTQFSKETKKQIMLLSSESGFYIDLLGENGEFPEIGEGDGDLQFGKCSHCESYFFCNMIGSYHCRKCKTHEGDHDLLSYEFFKD